MFHALFGLLIKLGDWVIMGTSFTSLPDMVQALGSLFPVKAKDAGISSP